MKGRFAIGLMAVIALLQWTLFLPLHRAALGAVANPGSIVQVVYSTTGALATMTTLIPYDDTIPQITEGTEVLTATITPKYATSKLIITFTTCGAITAAFQHVICALFQDATANALAANANKITGTDITEMYVLQYAMTSGTTSATTFRIRMGPESSGTFAINGDTFGGAARKFGGVASTTLSVMEVVP